MILNAMDAAAGASGTPGRRALIGPADVDLDGGSEETAAEALRGYLDLVDEYTTTITPQDTAARWQDVLVAAGLAQHGASS